ncbi:MAG TPA: UbiA family prenyltransferase [Ktedonobacterales bacterium]|jgi:4-hydroxybenzoate polyprenyltransferase
MSKKRSIGEILYGFFLLNHPGPVAIHIIGVAIFAFVAARSHLVWGVLLLVIGAHAAMQSSIAMMNDYCDRRLDALTKPAKPIVRGLVLPREALVASIFMMVLMVVLLLFLPPLALLLSLCYLALGQSYNFGLKSTPWSGLVFALFIPLIPLYALAGVGNLPLTAFWILPLGSLLGVVLNLANSLPDIEGDSAGGANTLAVKLGVRGVFIVCPLLIALDVVLMGVLLVSGAVAASVWVIGGVLAGTVLAVGAMVLFFGPQKPIQTRKWYFYLVTLFCLLLGTTWLVLVAF